MKNTRGFLLAEETLKIVIAVICIGFLVYFLISLYMANKNSKNLELAKSSLEHLINEVDFGIENVEIYNPQNWVVVSWPHDTTQRIWYTGFIMSKTKEGLPASCFNMGWNKCLCICKNNDKDSCDKEGICSESELMVEGYSIEINPVPKILTIKDGKIK